MSTPAPLPDSQGRAICWPHAPKHILGEQGTYFVTGRTYRKEHYFHGDERLGVLHRGLLKVANDYRWELEAWAVFPNHYHFVAHSPADATSLSSMLSYLHERTASFVNERDGTPARKVWHNYWESLLTLETSYYTRLNYVHQNAVHHGVVRRAADYSYCSAQWFERTATAAQVKSVYAFKFDKLAIRDEL